MENRSLTLGLALFCLCLLVLVAGCEKKPSEVETAIQKLVELRAETDGDRALKKKEEIIKTLAFYGKVDFKKIGIDDEYELDRLVRDAYQMQATKALETLKDIKAAPQNAEVQRTEFLYAQEKSGLPVTDYGTSLAAIEHMVIRKYLYQAGQRSVKPNAADYKAAGLPMLVQCIPAPDPKTRSRTETRASAPLYAPTIDVPVTKPCGKKARKTLY